MNNQPTIFLKTGREKSLLNRHPWVFSGAVERQEGNPLPGSTVAVNSIHGSLLGFAAFSPVSQIRARMWTFNDEPVDKKFLAKRLVNAFQLRQMLGVVQAGHAYRLVNAESDGLPGLVVDVYDRVVVVQFLSAGAEYWRDTISSLLKDILDARCIYERSDVDVRKLEGLEQRTGWLVGGGCDCPVTIQENEHRFLVDYQQGHKTGFYLDQHENRRTLQEYLARLGGKGSLLNCFCYTGAFSVAARAAGIQQVCSLDSSGSALQLAKENMSLNGYDPDTAEWIEGDVFQELRRMRDSRRSFDAIVLDPPKFAATISQVERAARAYKDINLLAFKLLNPGGLLFTFSCSGGVSAELFQKIVAGAALDAGVEVKILQHLGQSPDHPVSIHFPEGNYLKGLVCQVGWGK